MYENVLIPTDGSEAVQQAIDEAIDLARMTDATVHALSVVDSGDLGLVPNVDVVLVEGALEEIADRATEEVRKRAESAGVDVRTSMRYGSPQEEILAYADERDVDLIVMGTHGRTNIDRLLLGSVTERVVRNADQPVLVKRMQEESNGGQSR